MKCKTILVTTLLLGFSDLMAQNQIGTIAKPDAVGIYCVGYGNYKEERKELILTEDENKMNKQILWGSVDTSETCGMAIANMLSTDRRKEISDRLTEAGYRTEGVSDLLPSCKGWQWTKTRCVDTYKSLYDKKAKFLEELYDRSNAADKELDKKLGY